jgi:ATP-dependent DNA helicase RecG
MPQHAADYLISAISKHISCGTKMFWVTPTVQESHTAQYAGTSALERFEQLNRHFPGFVGLLHGGMDSKEKYQVLSEFRHGKTRLLVTTSVIEVGIDIPDVSICVVDRAERFGLSQLHQIRGRIGRGPAPETGNLFMGVSDCNFNLTCSLKRF